MDVEGLVGRIAPMVARMRAEGYAESYVLAVLTDARWLEREGGAYGTWEEACLARQAETASEEMRRRYRGNFAAIRRYVEEGLAPDRRLHGPLVPRGAYHRLAGAFRSVVDAFAADARSRGLKEKTVRGHSSAASCFLLAMQELGRRDLSEVTGADAMGYFTGPDGLPSRSAGTKKDVYAVLTSDLGDDVSAEAARVAMLLPCLRPARRNIDYLRPDEAEAVRSAIADEGSGLCARDRAIMSVMYHAGVRAVDVAGMRVADVDWAHDRIELKQEKTGAMLVVPLTAAIGNPLFDYLAESRPDTGDDHVFLGLRPPHDPLTPGALGHVAARAYDAAGVRGDEGRRRGTHILRHHAATKMVSSGVPRTVASAVLGHRDPGSIDAYLTADIDDLRRCALDVSRFPLAEGVYGE